eukprot:5407751-Pyramimonas_sp.AAC.1
MALVGGHARVAGMRIFRYSKGFCHGNPLGGNYGAYSSLWYIVILDTAHEPIYEDDGEFAHDKLDMGWNAAHESDFDYDKVDGPI